MFLPRWLLEGAMKGVSRWKTIWSTASARVCNNVMKLRTWNWKYTFILWAHPVKLLHSLIKLNISPREWHHKIANSYRNLKLHSKSGVVCHGDTQGMQHQRPLMYFDIHFRPPDSLIVIWCTVGLCATLWFQYSNMVLFPWYGSSWFLTGHIYNDGWGNIRVLLGLVPSSIIPLP